MKNLMLLLFLLTCITITAQQNQNFTIKKDSIDYGQEISFKLGGGVFIPQKELRDFIGVSPLIETNINFPLSRKRSFDLVFQFVIPKNEKKFSFERTIDVVEAKSTLLFNAFLRFNKGLTISKKSTLFFSTGLGVSTITTDARNPFYSGAEDEDKYEFISSILIAPGLRYNFSLFNKNDIEIGIEYLYSPYKTEGALLDNIGNAGVATKLIYKF